MHAIFFENINTIATVSLTASIKLSQKNIQK